MEKRTEEAIKRGLMGHSMRESAKITGGTVEGKRRGWMVHRMKVALRMILYMERVFSRGQTARNCKVCGRMMCWIR